jgi:hypothetical protein
VDPSKTTDWALLGDGDSPVQARSRMGPTEQIIRLTIQITKRFTRGTLTVRQMRWTPGARTRRVSQGQRLSSAPPYPGGLLSVSAAVRYLGAVDVNIFVFLRDVRIEASVLLFSKRLFNHQTLRRGHKVLGNSLYIHKLQFIVGYARGRSFDGYFSLSHFSAHVDC